ncbi:sensor protein ZraS [bacterium BMS3Abin07]|nr:sensor protein ZraS [bacterium BMS3Abin07]GBE32612.1 sensor protein ZraS [bacterium BMS3Bbin05]HDO22274.1 GHKL domain-containing protein [Nitrospirota bacterium]
MQSDDNYVKLKVLIAFRLLFVTILLVAYFILQLEYRLFPYPKLTVFLIGFIYFLNIVYLLLIKLGGINPKLFGYTQLTLDILTEIILILATGGIESWFTITLLLTVISSSIVIDKKAGYVMAAVAGIIYGVAIDLQYYQVIPVAYSKALAEKDFLYNIVINILAVYLTAYLIGHLTSGLETTKRRLDEKSINLRELSHFHSDVIENIPSGLFSTDPGGRVRLFNMAAEAITGIGREKAVLLNIDEIFDFIKLPLKPGRYNGLIETKKGNRNIGMSISKHRNQDNETVGYIGTFQDLSDIVRLENEIKKREKFAAIGELSANIAHEIRNPLASIKGSIEMIKEGRGNDADRDKLMDIALDEMTRLNEIITDFLIYSHPKPLKRMKCDISALLADTTTLLKSSMVWNDGIRYNEEIETPLHIIADGDKLKQVFWNLLTNAAESLNGAGLISVKAWERTGNVFIEITDSGAGIREEDLERIFYPFYTTKREGTGLGLAIAYRIIEEHNGNIDVRSGEGKGTTFAIKLPFEQGLKE